MGDWSDDAIGSKRRCRDGNLNLGKVRCFCSLLTNCEIHRHRCPNNWRRRNLWPRGRTACMFGSQHGSQHVGIQCCCGLLVLLPRYTKCIRVRDTNGWLVICDFEGHMRCMDEWAIVRNVASFTAFVAYRGFHSRAAVLDVALQFESAFAIGALCSGHSKLLALL